MSSKNLFFYTLLAVQLFISGNIFSQGCSEGADPCKGLTYTQGRYGTTNCNSSSYLTNNFSTVFPNGLVIGCGGRQLKFTSASAIAAFLPSGTTPTCLPTGTLTNPGSTYKNVLAGQLVALTLNMMFDQNDPYFSPSAISLANYTITSGTFSGMRVDNFLALANSIIGGCSSQYSYSQINTAATNINENYDDGSSDQGFLKCGGACSITIGASYSPILCYGGIATVTITASGGKSPYGGIGTFTATAGIQTYTVMDAYGCMGTKTINISQPTQLVATSSAGSITCNGGTTNVTVSASGGTSPYTGTGAFTKTSGAYTFTISDSKGCVATTTRTLSEPSPIVVSANAAAIACYGGSTTVTVSAAGGTPPYSSGTGTFNKTAGIYTFTVTDSKGCKGVTTITLTQASSPLTASATLGTIDCYGSSTSLTISASGGTAPYTGTGIFTKTAGIYSFTVTDAKGCTAVITRTITQPSQLVANASSCGAINCNGGSATVTVTATGGNTPYTGTGVFTRTAGVYSFTVTDAKGCTAITTETLTQPDPFTVNALAGTISCFGGSTNVTVTANGGASPYTGTGTFTKPAGIHSFTITDHNGCTSVKTITITQPSQLVVNATSPGVISCNGGLATVTITASGGTAPYSGIGVFTKTAGIYSFTVTDAKGCSAVVTETITQTNPVTVNAVTGTISCFGGNTTVTITASGGASPYTGTGTFTEPAGVHTFTITDANGCTSVKTITITEPSQLVANAASCGTISCNGGSATISVTATGGTPPYSGIGVFTKNGGVHTFTVTDSNGCTSVISHTLLQPNQFSVTTSSAGISCFGSSTTVSVFANGGTAPYSGTGTFTANAGIHIYTVTDTKGCMALTTLALTQPTQLIANATSCGIINCNGGSTTISVTATGGTAPYSGTGVFTKTAGVYTFTVTDANGCTSIITHTLTQPSPINVSASSNGILCFGALANVSVSASGGIAPYNGTGTFTAGAGVHIYTVTDTKGCMALTTLTLTEPLQLTASAQSGTLSGFGATTTVTVSANGGTAPYSGTGVFTVGAGTYTYLITDANGCSATTTVTINQPGQLSATAIAGTILCNGETTTVSVTANGGVAPYTGTGTFVANVGSHSYLVTDANGYTVTANVTIAQPSPLTASSLAGAILCSGGTTTLIISASGGTAPYSGTGVFTVPAGTYTYLVTDANGCTALTTVTLTQPSQLTANAVSSGTVDCSGGSTTISITATGGTAPYSGIGVFTKPAGVYTFTVTDANGCTSIITHTLTQPNPINASATSAGILCFGASANVIVSSVGGTAPYTGTGTFTANVGVHTYTVTDAKGCLALTSLTLTQPSQLTVSAVSGTLNSFGATTTITVSANGGTAPYSGTGVFTIEAGTYTYIVTDANGCSATTTITVTQPSQLTATATSGTIDCFGGLTTVTVSANGGIPPYTGTGTFVASAGTNTYLVTDANDNTVVASINITEPSQLIATSASGLILCNGGITTVTVSANGGTAGYFGTGTYTAGAGSYTYLVTDSKGCSATTTITITQPVQLTASIQSGTLSGFGASTTVTVSANGGTTPYSGTGIFTVGAGTYTYLVTDANGCSTTVTVTITQPSQLTATAIAGTILCNGGTTTVSVSANGGVAPYTGTGTFVASAGTNTYLVTDANGYTVIASVNITQPSQLIANSVSGLILCNGGITTVTVSANGGTTPYSGTGVFTVSAGTYSYLITDANGCSATTSITVSEPTPLTASAVSGTLSGFGASTTVTVSANGGTTPYFGTGTFTVSAGTYTYLVTDANGCSTTVTITITQPGQLTAIAIAGTILCNGGTTTVNVSASGGIAPYTGTGTFVASAGTNTYLVTDANGYTIVASVTISQPSQLIANSASGSILCHGGITTITVYANGGTAPYSGTGVFTVSAGTYSYLVTDANGCSAITSIIVSEPTQLTASVQSGTLSGFGASTTVTVSANGGTPAYSGTGVFTVSAGTYTYLVTDANGCSTTVSITITQPGQLTATATAGTILCNGGTTTVNISANGGTTPYTGTGTFVASAGTNTYLVTDANGYTVVASVNITEPSQMVATSISGSILCFGGTTSVTVSANGGTAPYNGTGVFTATAGLRSFTLTDANGCAASTTLTITQPAQLIANAISGAAINCNSGSTTISVTATGGTAPYTGIGVFIKTAGIHSFTVTDANSCTSVISYTLSQPDPFNATATTTGISCFGGQATISIAANGGTAPYSGTGTFTAGAGVHTFTVIDSKGCTAITTLTLNQPSQLTVSALSGTLPGFGSTTTVTVSANGGTPPYSGTGIFTAGAGTYTYLITDANGCSSSTIITITQPGQLTASAVAGTIGCFGGLTTVTVSANGGTTPYNGTGTFVAGAGTNTYLVTDASGYTVVASINITEPSHLITSSTAGNILCNGGITTVTVSANGGTAPYSGTGIFTVTAGTYSYLVTDANGCFATTSITIAEPSILTASALSNGTINCNGGSTTISVTATGGTAPYSGTGVFTKTAGVYTFTVTDANGCTSIITHTLTQPNPINVSASSNGILCFGALANVSVSASGGIAPYNGTGTFTAGAGVHIYTVTDTKGCMALTTLTLTEPLQLTASAQSGTLSGFGATTTVTVFANGGTAPYSGTGVFTVGAGTYTYLVTDANGCSATITVTINQPGQLNATAIAGTILCNDGTTTVSVTANGGVAPYTGTGTFVASAGSHSYLVTDANGYTVTANVTIAQPSLLTTSSLAGSILCSGGTTTLIISASGGTAPYSGTGVFTVSAGTYSYLITDANGCSATTSIIVSEPTQLTASAQSGTLSGFGATTTVTVSANGGTPAYSGTGIFTVGAGTYTYLVTDANGCSTTVTITITQPGQLTATAIAGTILCNGGTTTLTVSANGGVAPYTGTGTFVASAGTNTYLVTDTNSYTVVASVNITEPSQINALSTAGSILCNGGTTTVTVSANGGTSPYFGVGIFTVTAGTYSYLVTDVNGCSTITSITVTEPTSLTASAISGTLSGFGATTTVTVSANGGTAPYSGTGVFTVGAGTYTYLVIDANGCSTTVSITITQPGQLTATATAGTILCNGGTTTVNVSANGGTTPYIGTGTFVASAGTNTYLVTDANGYTVVASVNITEPSQLIATSVSGSILCNGGTTTVTVSANGGTTPYSRTGIFTVSAGTYSYLVTDANGCSAITSITITEPTPLTANAISGTLSGFGATTAVTVSANGGTAPYSGTGVFTVGAGTYTYLVTDANGCSATTTVTINQPGQLNATAASGTIGCFGGSTTVTISANGGVAPYTGTGTFVASAGSYSYLVTDANGYTVTANVTIAQPSPLTASSLAGAILCSSGTTTLIISASGGTAPYSETGVFTVSAGTYSYLISDANGCSAITSITITEPSQLIANSASGSILCKGGITTVTVSANGGIAPYFGAVIFTVTAGTYSYLVTDANGCSATISITVTEPTPLTANAVSGTLSGFGATTTVTVSANGGTTPYSGTGIFTVSAGTYTYLVIDANGCSATVTITITQPGQLTATAIAGTILCNGGTTTVNVSASGGIAPYTGTGTFVASAGTNTYLVTDANGYTVVASVNITQPSQLIATSVSGLILCNGGSTTVTVSANGGTAPYFGVGIFTVTAGTYSYLVTDANSCSATISITVTEPTSLTASAISGTLSGFGATTTVTVSANGGTPAYSGTGIFTVGAGTYTYLVTDANGCSTTVTITITQPGQLNVTAIAGTILCNGGTTTVTVSANGGVAPYTGTGTFVASAGTNTYLVTDANGYTVVASVNITEPSQINALSTAGSILCNGGTTTVTVSASGGTGPYSGTGIFTVSAGTYSYLITDANGCSAITSITITERSQLIANSASGSVLCNGGVTSVTVSANGGTAPYFGVGIFTVTAGTYSYLVTDVNGCSTITSITVTEPTPLTANAVSGTLSGFGATTTVTVSANGGTAPHSGTGVFTVGAGTYTYLVTDANGCSTTVTITITQPGQLNATAIAGTILCNGGTTTVSVTANGGVAPYTGTGTFVASAGTNTYLVTDANGYTVVASVTITEPSQLIASSTAGSILCNSGTTTVNISANGGTASYFGTGVFTVSAGTYSYLVTDANGCSATTSITVTEPTPLTANAVSGTLSGFGATTTVTVSANGGTTPYSGTGIFTVSAGTYTYLVIDANGCSATVTITITQPGQLTATAIAGTILCNGGTTTVNVSASGGIAPYTGTGTFVASAGTNTYLVTDANGYTVVASVTITQPSQLIANSTSSSILCNGGITIVTVSANGGTIPYSGINVFTVSAGTYSYLITDANGCFATSSITITEPTPLTANAISGLILCNGGITTGTASANGGTAPYSGTGVFTVSAGTYSYLITDANGCSATTSITVTEPTPLTASAVSGTLSGFGATTTVSVSANGGTPAYSGTGVFTVSAGTYTYLVIDANGCSATIIVTINQPGQLNATAIAGTILCNGGTTTVSVTANGGVAPYTGTGTFVASAGTNTYLVTDANGYTVVTSVTITEPSQLIATSTAGSILCNGGITTITISTNGGTVPYSGIGVFTVSAGTYTYLVTDANGCSAITSINITEPTPLTASAISGTVSGFGATTTVSVSASGGTSPYSGTGIFTVGAGTYTYLITDANGCSTTVTVTITQPGQLTATAIAGTILCNGGSTTVTVSANGGVAPYSGTGTFVASSGTNTYLVTDANGYTVVASVTVTEPSQLMVNAASGSILCNGGVTTVTVSANGGTAPYFGVGIFTVSAGTYTYLVTDANGCSATTSITITEPTSLTASAISGTLSGFGATTTVTVSANGGTPAYSGTGIFTVGAGTYTYLVTDANGCSTTVTITITQPGQLSATAIAGAILCNGGITTVSVSANGGVAPYSGTGTFVASAGTNTYLVTDANGYTVIASVNITQPSQLVANAAPGLILCNGGITTVTVSANGGTAPYSGTGTFTVSAGTYTYLVTDANGCSTITSIIVSEPSQLTASAQSGTLSGFGASTTVIVSANGGTPAYSGTGIFTVGAGTYTYLVTDANGCSTTVTVTITQPGQLTATAIAGTILCNGGTTTVSVSANGGVAPYTGTGTFVASAGTNTYLVTDANGYTVVASVNITEPSQLIANATSGLILCNGGITTITISANGGTAPYNGTGVFTANAGPYSFNITDANGCSSSIVGNIVQPSAVNVSAISGAILCNGDLTTVTVNATGGTSPYNGTGTFSVPADSYTFIVSDANGCSSSANISISEPLPLNLIAQEGFISCNGGSTTLNIGATGGTTPYSGTGLFTVFAGNYTYIITDANGCSTSTAITISEPSPLSIIANINNILCNGGNGSIDISGIGGTAPYTGEGNYSVNAGSYSYIITDANGCTTSTNITLTEPSILVLSTTVGNISCNGDLTTIDIVATGGTFPYSGDGIYNVTAGNYSYVITDANGCSTSTNVSVTEPSLLTLVSQEGTILCNGGSTSVNINAAGGTGPYLGEGVYSAFAGLNSYQVTDANGCSASTVITLSEPLLLTANSGITGNILCNGGLGSVDVVGSGGTAPYSGDGSYSVPAGSYTYIVSDANGCTTATELTITEPDPVNVTATPGPCSGGLIPVTISASGGTAPYTGETVDNLPAGNYTYQVFDTNGCPGSVTFNVDTAGCAFANRMSALTNEDPSLVYPNPNNGTFNVKFNYSGSATIINQAGQIVREIEIVEGTETRIANLDKGIYYMITPREKVKIVVIE